MSQPWLSKSQYSFTFISAEHAQRSGVRLTGSCGSPWSLGMLLLLRHNSGQVQLLGLIIGLFTVTGAPGNVHWVLITGNGTGLHWENTRVHQRVILYNLRTQRTIYCISPSVPYHVLSTVYINNRRNWWWVLLEVKRNSLVKSMFFSKTPFSFRNFSNTKCCWNTSSCTKTVPS